MADFIKLIEFYWDDEGFRRESFKILNKSLIKSIEEDPHHDQTIIIYDNGDEVRVKETLSEINIKCAE